jgi:hypothetical protein
VEVFVVVRCNFYSYHTFSSKKGAIIAKPSVKSEILGSHGSEHSNVFLGCDTMYTCR